MAKLKLSIPQPNVARNISFFGAVFISDATPSSNIIVTLQQVSGAGNWRSTANAQADVHGVAVASFPSINLPGIAGGFDNATLLATATGAPADSFSSDAESVDVV